MGFFRDAHNFVIQGDNPHLPNVPEIMAGVADIIHDVPSGSHFRGTLQIMDENTLNYLKAELSRKDALLQAMKERKARKPEAGRVDGMQCAGVGVYGVGNGDIQSTAPSPAPQVLGFDTSSGPQQGMNPIMLPGTLPVDVPLQGVPFVPQGMNVPPREFPPYRPIWEPDDYPMNASYFHGPLSVQSAPGYCILPTHPPSHVHHQEPLHINIVDPGELDETVELDFPSANESYDQYKSMRTGSFARED